MNKRSLGLIGMGMAAVLLAAVLVSCGAGPAVVAADQSPDTITVTGTGESRSDPDMATLNLGVNVSDLDISQAVADSNQTIAAITDAVKGLGVEESDIQTTNFNVWPEDVYDRDTGQPTGSRRFHVDSTVQINVRQVDDVGKILEAAIQSGANNIYGLNFGIQDTHGLSAEARTAALADARSRAEQVANELGVALGQVRSVVDNSGGTVYPVFQGAGIGGGGGEPPISQGQMTVTVNVTVSYEISR
jgi:uncharacterized protein YggE